MKRLKKVAAELRKHALTYPQTLEDFPWGHSVVKVKGKIFLSAYLDEKAGSLTLSMKLPVSNTIALTMPFAQPTRYGLGPSGWVTATFGVDDDVPIEMMREWMDESFRAVAPKRVLAELEQPETPTKPRRSKKKK